MRIDTSGNSFDNHGSSHRITHGLHDHHDVRMKSGEIRSAAAGTSLSEPISNDRSGEGMGIWRTITNGAKNLWGRVWGSSTGGVNEAGSVSGDANGTEQVMAQIGAADMAEGSGIDDHGPVVAAAANVAQTSMAKENPYFTTMPEQDESKDKFMQKVRIRFRELTNQFKKSFQGRFGGRKTGGYSGRGTLNSGEQKPKEDLRKHSRYREEGLEMDCVLTDDSYLMDSYDRTGGYSRLTTDTGTKSRT